MINKAGMFLAKSEGRRVIFQKKSSKRRKPVSNTRNSKCKAKDMSKHEAFGGGVINWTGQVEGDFSSESQGGWGNAGNARLCRRVQAMSSTTEAQEIFVYWTGG